MAEWADLAANRSHVDRYIWRLGEIGMTSDQREHPDPFPRPGDFARVLLAAGGDPPRARARDQQADMIGEAIKRRVLNRLIALDPEPDGLESALLAIVEDFGEPSGSTRAVCTTILQEWEMARVSPQFWPFLIGQALHADERPSRTRKNRGRSAD